MRKTRISQALVPALVLASLPNIISAQILDQPIVDTQPLLKPVEKTVRKVENEVTQKLENDRIPALPTELTQNLANQVGNLAQLPTELAVVNLNGNTAFMDVEVENGWRAVDREWLIMLQPGEMELLQSLDIEVLEQSVHDELGLSLVRIRVSNELNSREALRQVLPDDLVERLDRNHIYNPQNSPGQDVSPVLPASFCQQPISVGMIDTAIQLDHPAFRNSNITEKNFLGAEFAQPHGHGTAVAGLLVGSNTDVPSRLPNATLYSASVFYSRNQYAQGATMMHLVGGLNWLLQQHVSVINMSLAGPDNQVLATVINTITRQGKVIVAAAGNEGPASPPLYPAAYPQVISATAVDNEQNIYRWANRGDHIDFAAIGVSVVTARSGGEFGRESGTSMAAPVVTAFVACELANNGGETEHIIERLTKKAVDLGTQGRDPVFGYGLLR